MSSSASMSSGGIGERGKGASVVEFSLFDESMRHALISVYQRPEYSLLSMSRSYLYCWPIWRFVSVILSPQSEIQIFFGYWPSVSTMISCLRHSPFLPCPIWIARTSISFAVSWICFCFKEYKLKILCYEVFYTVTTIALKANTIRNMIVLWNVPLPVTSIALVNMYIDLIVFFIH